MRVAACVSSVLWSRFYEAASRKVSIPGTRSQPPLRLAPVQYRSPSCRHPVTPSPRHNPTSETLRSYDDPRIALISLVDLTERIRANEMLQQLQADCAHAARVVMLGQLTPSIAHVLKEPLAAMATNGQAPQRRLDRPGLIL